MITSIRKILVLAILDSKVLHQFCLRWELSIVVWRQIIMFMFTYNHDFTQILIYQHLNWTWNQLRNSKLNRMHIFFFVNVRLLRTGIIKSSGYLYWRNMLFQALHTCHAMPSVPLVKYKIYMHLQSLTKIKV